MRTPEPRIIRQAGLLWWQSVGAVHLRQILREDDATLQLLCTRVGTLTEVYDSAFVPPAVPGLDDSLQFLAKDELLDICFWLLAVFCLKLE